MLLAQRLAVPHVATGDLFRAAVRDGSPVGLEARRYMERGQLVPDDITIQMLLDRLDQRDAAGGVILDGFPRNRAQAEILDAALAERGAKVDRAVSIEVPGRRPRPAPVGPLGVPRLGPRLQRDDRTRRASRAAATSTARRSSSARTTRPRPSARGWRMQLSSLRDVIAYYRATGVLRQIDGLQPIDEVADAIAGARRPTTPSGAV